MTFLRHTVAQLVDPERQDPSLFQFTIEFAELLGELFAFVGDIGALGGCILGGRGTKLLQALLRLAGPGFEPVILGPQCVRPLVRGSSKSCRAFTGVLSLPTEGLVSFSGRFI